MSRKDKHNIHKKKKRKGLFGTTALDSHHIFYTRVSWNQPVPNRLRSHWYCIVDIPKGTVHHAIHNAIRYIPVPRNDCILAALDQLYLLEDYGAIRPDDPIEKRLAVLAGLFDCVAQPTADALIAQLDIINSFNKPSS